MACCITFIEIKSQSLLHRLLLSSLTFIKLFYVQNNLGIFHQPTCSHREGNTMKMTKICSPPWKLPLIGQQSKIRGNSENFKPNVWGLEKIPIGCTVTVYSSSHSIIGFCQCPWRIIFIKKLKSKYESLCSF